MKKLLTNQLEAVSHKYSRITPVIFGLLKLDGKIEKT
jgi:hypothetical protein